MEYTGFTPNTMSELASEPKAPGVRDIIQEIQTAQLKAADMLATILGAISGERFDPPVYKDPEHMTMALLCCEETANFVVNMANKILERM